MGTKRHSKTASQQCRYYEVDNIFEYMVDTYINGNITSFKDIYRELNTVSYTHLTLPTIA